MSNPYCRYLFLKENFGFKWGDRILGWQNLNGLNLDNLFVDLYIIRRWEENDKTCFVSVNQLELHHVKECTNLDHGIYNTHVQDLVK